MSANAYYCKQCQRCHDQDGRGGKARPNSPEIPDFSSKNWQESRNDAQLTVSILEGKGTAMPPFAGRLTRKDVRELVTHVRSYRAKPADPTKSEQDDFTKCFRELQKELEGLRRQFRELSEKNSKP